MRFNWIGNVFVGLVGVAALTVVVSHRESANVVKSIGGATADLFRAAQGR